MSVRKIHKDRITQIALLDLLRKKMVPSVSTINLTVKDLLRIKAFDANGNRADKDLNLTYPLTPQLYKDFTSFEHSSAENFNKLTARLYSDLDTLYDSMLHIEKQNLGQIEADLIRMGGIERKVRDLISNANRLLLLTEETEGLLSVVGDDFVTTGKTDQSRTNAIIDIKGGVIHSNVINPDAVINRVLDLGRMTPDDFIVSFRSEDGALLTRSGGNDLENMTRDRETPWFISLSQPAASDSPVIVEVTLDMLKVGRPFITTTKISLEPFLQINSLVLLIQHSQDGASWQELPVEEPIRTITGPTAYVFKETSFRFLKVFLLKKIHDRESDDGTKYYDIGIRSIQLWEMGSEFMEESEFYSTQHFPLDGEGAKQKFTSAALSTVCHQIPEDTSIEYSISFLIPQAGDVPYRESKFQRISPLNDRDPVYPLVAEIGGLGDLATRAHPQTSTLTFRGSSDSKNILLFNDAEELLLLQGDYSRLKIWRNVGNRDRFRTIRHPGGGIVEEGWLFDGNYYSCYLEIQASDGQVIDFGPNLEIDGEEVSGTVRLTTGIHHIKIASENWLSFGGISNITDFDEVSRTFTATRKEVWGGAGLEDAISPGAIGNFTVHDALYPYNQKALVEGLTYDVGYEGVKNYRQNGRYAAYLMTRIPEFEFERNIDNLDYSKFAIIDTKDDQDVESSGAIVVKIDKSLAQRSLDPASWTPREFFDVVRQTSSVTFAEGLVFKALFKTSNIKHCPSLDGYEIKVVE